MSPEEDVIEIQNALIVLSGHLPLFSSDKQKVARAEVHLKWRDSAFDALDRVADRLEVKRVPRRMTA